MTRRWKLFFANSGAEANEGAIKLARGGRARTGPARTSSSPPSAPSTAGRSRRSRPPASPRSRRRSRRCPRASSTCRSTTSTRSRRRSTSGGAVLLEPVQGEGGVWPCAAGVPRGRAAHLRRAGRAAHVRRGADGFYRTGPAFAFQAYGVVPDVVTLAKALANGLPIGAVAGTRRRAPTRSQPGDHGSTFGGGPVVRAAGRATARRTCRRAPRRERARGRRLPAEGPLPRSRQATGAIDDVRGAGLMVGVTLTRARRRRGRGRGARAGRRPEQHRSGYFRFLAAARVCTGEVDTLLEVLCRHTRQGALR